MFSMMPYRYNHNMKTRNDTDAFNAMFNPFSDDFFRPFFGENYASAFRVDVEDKGDHFELAADMPGMSRENVDIHIENGMMTITAQVKAEENEDKKNYVYHERRCGTMSRSFNIEGIDEEKVAAQFKDGVLHVTLPKKQDTTPEGGRRIEIQ